MDEVRWGMIGCGDVTEVKSGPAFGKVAGSKLVAVMRRSKDKAADYARRHQVPKWYDDADKLIRDPEVNAIYVATPPSSHAQYTIAAAEAGKPVYVEKPMARTYNECQQMIEACRNARVPLFVAYYRRCLPAFVKIKELVDSGIIGEIRFLKIELLLPPRPEDLNEKDLPWRVRPEISGGGYFFDLAAHQLDFLDFVFGAIVSVQGRAANQAKWYAAEDVVCANFQFESGVIGSGIWCFTVPDFNESDRTEIIGSKGKIVYSTFERVPVRLQTEEGIQEFDLPPPPHVQQPLIQTVVAELLGQVGCPSTGETAARTSRVMEEIVVGGGVDP